MSNPILDARTFDRLAEGLYQMASAKGYGPSDFPEDSMARMFLEAKQRLDAQRFHRIADAPYWRNQGVL